MTTPWFSISSGNEMKKKRKKNRSARVKWFLIKIVLSILLFTWAQVAVLKVINPFTTPNVAWEWGESIWKDDPDKRPVYIFKPIDQISPHLRRAVLAAEDQRFLMHHGFDLKEIQQVLHRFVKDGRLRGASTISMQTARSVFWLSSRSVVRKVVEIYYTILIELFWDKRRILEIYLNTVDWGTGVTGAEAAAQKYFSVSAEKLSPAQAALMTAVLPNPHRWSVRQPSPYIKKRQLKIMEEMKKMPLL